jgi:hypothetical protein
MIDKLQESVRCGKLPVHRAKCRNFVLFKLCSFMEGAILIHMGQLDFL